MSEPPPPGASGGVYPSLGFEGVADPVAGTAQPLPSYRAAMDSNENTSLVKTNGAGAGGDYGTEDVKLDMKGVDENEVPDRNTLMFRDGERVIDYVLAYRDLDDEHDTAKREAFHEALKLEGLELEHEDKRFSQDTETYFTKVHMPWHLCLDYAELMKMKMPIQTNDIDEPLTAQCCTPCGSCRPNIEEEEDFFTAPFYKDGTFIGYNGPHSPSADFFSPAQRSRMVHEILLRTRYGEEQQQFGIKRLFRQSIYTAYYPLHDGAYKLDKGVANDGTVQLNKRQELFYEWSRPGAFMKEQPYDAIRHYFGEKVAIYFSWLGFYTLMLVPASIVGLIVFIYGLATMMTDDVSNDICGDLGKNMVMCPQCDKRCGYWFLSDSCKYSKAAYVVDNPSTIFFTIFMALWATFFIEFWKRKQARLQYDWDVSDYEEIEQSMRPEFQASVSNKKKNPITQNYEPHMRSWERCARVMSSLVFIVFLMCVVFAAILAVIIYRIFIVLLLYQTTDVFIKKNARIITTITAAALSVVIITILNKVYEKIAIFLTNMETWKYQSEWEDSFTIKMYLFQFANYYGTIFYIAFFKGSINGTPNKYDRSFGGRGEECDPAGCLIELAIQLAIVMVGKQTLNNFKEIAVPMLCKCFKARKGRKKIETDDDKYTSWERDYDLVDFPVHGLYEEYLEMVIQYGFVTLFVAAFPLAPFFALLNNIIEVRLDATKMITQWKRPMAERAQDIGTWFTILVAISKLAVLINAAIIAFTSEFVKKSIYEYTDVLENTNQTFIEWSLAEFRTSDFETASRPDDKTEEAMFGNLDRESHVCRYRDFINNPNSTNWVDDDPSTHYIHTTSYWHVLTAKLAFVLVFEHLVLAIASLINYLVPDVPIDIRDRTLREKHLAKIAQHERIKVAKGSKQEPANATQL